MEDKNQESNIGDTCNLNGNCSPPTKNNSIDLNHAKNIDDISTPSELKFDEDFEFEDPDVTAKRKEMERCLENPDIVNIEEWQHFAKSKGGLIADEYRRRIWPLLVGVTREEMTEPPSLDELSTHVEYNQVVLDVNRSLKRFPPGIPYEQRVALQDQLTVLILRVIIEYPHLKYYQFWVRTPPCHVPCPAPLFPVYVTAALVLHRAPAVLACDLDMAMMHCLLSRLPDDLPFEDILVTAKKLYEDNDPTDLEDEVDALERREEEQRRLDEERLRQRRVERAGRSRAGAGMLARLRRVLPRSPLARGAALAAAAALLAVYAYYRPDLFTRRRADSPDFEGF
ncbi:PREDICTED: TBC1 domain family member 20-like [Papilio polytes]|uniref:TBC1 domain family member 20-like n=1 Tax=Papilio polytes TaxID=76194 RepID=UPI0006768AD2|nr:PREDICTED: TBC1 domain family member 20-like [Papilio polytes]